MTPWIFALQPLKKRLGLQAETLFDLSLHGIPDPGKRVFAGPPTAFLLQFARQPLQTPIPSRCGRVHPRFRRRNLLILFRIRQLRVASSRDGAN
jgi:hypothetical protein